ncbi:MAG TPA: TetR/AcrR family transcriptional regulator [Polyangiaceae bacterium]|nr:TetR/AcrR family transcriptional regulator [Polyangiaceae bacterium]
MWNNHSAMTVAAEAAAKEEKKTQLILSAALELFAERGFHGTSIPLVLGRAGVGASSLYRRFESKEALVNAVFRDAKRRLAAALHEGLDAGLPPRALFGEFWARLASFARREPVAFRFLELQDHAPYLDAESRAVELAALGPIYLTCLDLQRRGALRDDLPAGALIAFAWGAFVGLFKAERTHHLPVTDAALDAARDACWRAFAGEGDRRKEPTDGDDLRHDRGGRPGCGPGARPRHARRKRRLRAR